MHDDNVRDRANETSVGDVPAPAFKAKYLPITHFDAMLEKVREALKEYEESWRRGCDNSGDARAEYERAAVVKYLRTMAESTTFSTRAQSALRLAAEEIERGMHQP